MTILENPPTTEAMVSGNSIPCGVDWFVPDVVVVVVYVVVVVVFVTVLSLTGA